MTDKVTAIQKIQQMEHILNRQQQWHEQLEQDAKGQLPEELHCGVLSEDGIYTSLVDYREMAEALAQLSQQMLDAVFTERNG